MSSSCVGCGSRGTTRSIAPSCSVPLGVPSMSRSIRPSAGSGVSLLMPAISRAREFTQAPCPSRFGRNAGRMRPASSTISVSAPRSSATSSFDPTATMRPSRTATASAQLRAPSTV